MEQPLGGAAVLIVLKQVAEELTVNGKSNKLEWGAEGKPRGHQLVHLLWAMSEGRDLELTRQALSLYHGDRYQGQDIVISAIEQLYEHNAELFAKELAQALAPILGVELTPHRHIKSEVG